MLPSMARPETGRGNGGVWRFACDGLHARLWQCSKVCISRCPLTLPSPRGERRSSRLISLAETITSLFLSPRGEGRVRGRSGLRNLSEKRGGMRSRPTRSSIPCGIKPWLPKIFVSPTRCFHLLFHTPRNYFHTILSPTFMSMLFSFGRTGETITWTGTEPLRSTAKRWNA